MSSALLGTAPMKQQHVYPGPLWDRGMCMEGELGWPGGCLVLNVSLGDGCKLETPVG